MWSVVGDSYWVTVTQLQRVIEASARRSPWGMEAPPRGGGAHLETDLAEALSVCLPRLHGSWELWRECAGRVAPVWTGWVRFSDLISLLDGSPWEISIRRDLLSLRRGLPPAQSFWNCGCGPWGGTAHKFRSLNWVCCDHSPIQSSLQKESVLLEVNLHFLMRQPPAWPS